MGSSAPQDKGFIPPPSFTTVRFDPLQNDRENSRQSLITAIKNDLETRGISPLDHGAVLQVEFHPVIPDVLLIPVHSLSDWVPDHKEVVIDRSCGMAVLRGAHVFAPGIIGAPQSLSEGDHVSVVADLEGKCLKGATATLNSRKMFLGNGIAEVSRHALFISSTKVNGIGIRMTEPLYLSPCLDQKSLPTSCFLQNLPSIVVGHVLEPHLNDVVLDMCAAPGGKATHICSLLKGTGHVIALDRSKAKVEKIKQNAEKLGYSERLSAFAADSRKIVSDKGTKTMSTDFSPPYSPESFSRILLDAPCSALGQRPRFPETTPSKESTISSYPSLQWQLFATAVKLLRPGGTMVYSTCTTTYAENEGMVERALEQYTDLRLVRQTPHIGDSGRREQSSLSAEQLNLVQYFPMLPSERTVGHPADNDTIGFFIAKFEKAR